MKMALNALLCKAFRVDAGLGKAFTFTDAATLSVSYCSRTKKE